MLKNIRKRASIRNSVRSSVCDSVGNGVSNSVGNGVCNSVGNGASNSVGNGVNNSVGNGVSNSVRALILLLVLFLMVPITVGCQNNTRRSSTRSTVNPQVAAAEQEIRDTLKSFDKDFNDCMDCSVLLHGRTLNFNPLRDYCENDDVYDLLSECEKEWNENARLVDYMRITKDLSGSLAGGLVGGAAGLLAGNFAGSVFGEAGGKMVQGAVGKSVTDVISGEIKDDPLFNETVWKDIASVRVKVVNVTVNNNGKRAAIEMDWVFRSDVSQMNNSKLLMYYYTDLIELNSAPVEEIWTVTAEMEKDRYDEWVFTELVK